MATHQGITTDEAWNMIPQDERSFLWQYLNYGIEFGDSPLAYHVATGYALLASVAPSELRSADFSGGRMPANFYGLLVGPTGAGHKTTALKRGSQIFLDAGFLSRYKSSIGSTEAVEDDLMDQKGRITLWYAEFGNFLKEALDGHKTGAKAWLTEQFDCDPIDKRTRGKGRVFCSEPRLCVVGAVNHSYIEGFTKKEDWTTGLFSRVFMAHSRDVRKDPDVYTKDTSRHDWLVSRLLEISKTKVMPGGDLSPRAEQRWRAFLSQVESQKKKLNTVEATAANARVATMAIKIALLLMLDFEYGDYVMTPGWEIQDECLAIGIEAAKLHWRESIYMANLVSGTDEGRLLRQILAALRRYSDLHNGSPLVPYAWLVKDGLNNDVLVRDLKNYLETLTVSNQALMLEATNHDTGKKEAHIKLIGESLTEGAMNAWLEDTLRKFEQEL